MVDKICLISTTRSTIGETISFVNYHLNVGIDEIVLFFDDPDDQATAFFADYRRVRSIKCDTEYWKSRGVELPNTIEQRQIFNVNYGLNLASKSGCDWIIHIDCDELLVSTDGIKNVLSEQAADVVRFSIKEAVSEKDHYDNRFETTLFREQITNEKQSDVALVYSMGCDGVFFEGEYFRGHSVSKVAVRINSTIEWMGIHGPQRPGMTEVKTDRITLLHYDCVGMDDWKNKWTRRIDNSGRAGNMRANRARQLDLFIEAYGNPAEELALYSRLHKISDDQKRILMQHGLLTVIAHKNELFERPKT